MSETLLQQADLHGVDLSQANLNAANLTRAELNAVKVAQTQFIDVVGISAQMKLEFQQQGAIFH